MAQTPEAKVKAKACEVLKAIGAYYFKPVTGGYGASGVPDIVVCYKGRFVGIECKAKGNRTTALQDHNLEMIRNAGGISLVINETNIEQLQLLIHEAMND